MRGWAELAAMALFLLVLAGVLFAAMWSVGEASREEVALRQVSEICSRLRWGEEGVLECMQNPPLDPWKRRYSVRQDGSDIVVRSAGADGVFDTGDDIAAALDTATGRRVFLER